MNSATIPQISFIEFLPVSLFGGVMGLTGLCLHDGWRQFTNGSDRYVLSK
jgi:hypothetical protein